MCPSSKRTFGASVSETIAARGLVNGRGTKRTVPFVPLCPFGLTEDYGFVFVDQDFVLDVFLDGM